jgi:cytidine deaminase
MKKIALNTEITVYDSFSELPEHYQQLLQSARTALDLAYAPYSNFQVGAALLLEDGRILQGANQENASYPLCLCAERVALNNANIQAPSQQIQAMALTVLNPNKVIQEPATPCGACRQVICEQEERQQHPIPLILQGQKGPVYVLESGQQLLPLGFDRSFL